MGKLSGKKEISLYLDMSWSSVLKLKEEGMPMKKICGRWFSHTESIDNFIQKEVEKIPCQDK